MHPTVVVSGAIANKPLNGGSVWERMSWALGLRRLGCRVYFVERIRADSCVGRDGRPSDFSSSINQAFFEEATAGFELDGAALVLDDGADSTGMTLPEVSAVIESADLLVDLGAHLAGSALLSGCRRCALVDLDPGYTQIWHATGVFGDDLTRYDLHFSLAENVGRADCAIPAGDLRWRPVRQPVVLGQWPAFEPDGLSRFTTVASWRSPYGSIDHNGRTYGLKMHEWRNLIDLPTRVPFRFEAALDIDAAEEHDLVRLNGHGWSLVDPRVVASDADAFRTYVQGSDAEFSVAQGIYAHTNSGWFSDRTTRYLASGRPVLVQDTGFGRSLPVGEGIVAFRSLGEAADGARRIGRDYDGHARAAREIAETYFDSDSVLAAFLEEAGV